jgi:hypothetical protein
LQRVDFGFLNCSQRISRNDLSGMSFISSLLQLFSISPRPANIDSAIPCMMFQAELVINAPSANVYNNDCLAPHTTSQDTKELSLRRSVWQCVNLNKSTYFLLIALRAYKFICQLKYLPNILQNSHLSYIFIF